MQLFAPEERRLTPAARVPQADRARCGRRPRVERQFRVLRGVGAADGLDHERFHHQRPVHGYEAEPVPVGRLEGRAHGRFVGERDRQNGVAARVAQLRGDHQFHRVTGRALARDLGRSRPAERLGRCPQAVLDLHPGERPVDLALAQGADVGQAHAVGGEHPGQRVEQDALHAERVRHPAGVLTAGAAEALQGVAGDVVAPLHRDFLDGIGHVFHRDAQEPLGHGLRGQVGAAGGCDDLRGQLGKGLPGSLGVQGLVAVRAEHPGEVLGLQPAEQQVGVGHGERAAAAVAGRAGVGAGRVRAHAEAAAAKAQHRAAARGHGVDAHHRRAHAHPGHQGLEAAFERPVVMGDVRAGAAHVKADQPGVAAHGRGAGHADHPAGRAGEHRVATAEQGRVGEAAVGLHEQQARGAVAAADPVGHPVHVTAQAGAQVGVDHGGVAAGHQLDERAHPVAGRDLGEADGPGDPGQLLFVLREAVAVHEHDGHRAQAVGKGGAQVMLGLLPVERHQHPAGRVHPLVHLDHPLVQQLGQDHVAGEQLRPVLVADAQGVAESAGDDQERPFAGSFEQSVGGHGGAHPDRADAARRDGRIRAETEQGADAVHGRVRVAFRVFGEELAGGERAVRPPGDDIGEGAAPVDPELPGLPVCCLHASPPSMV